MGFAVDKVAWLQVYFPEFWFYRVAVTSARHNHTSIHHRCCIIVVRDETLKKKYL
jgi:hypothetical protein